MDYDLLYQNAFTVNRNFGNITLVAVFERTHADMTVQNSGSGLSDTQGTIYSIRGTAAKSGQSVSLTVAIVGDDSVTIKDLPVGVYTVTEQNAWTWRYDVSAVTDSDPASAATTAAGTITVDGNSTHEVTFSNYDLTSNKWLSINHALLPAGTYSLKKKQS